MAIQTVTYTPLITAGEFTPRYAAENGALGSITYAYQIGKYYRIGDLVQIWVELATASYSIPSPVVIPNLLYVDLPGAPTAWGSGSGLAATSQAMQCNNWYGYDGAHAFHPHSAAIYRGSNRVILGRGSQPGVASSLTRPGDAYNNEFTLVTELTNHTTNTRNECRFSMTYTTS